MLLSAVVTYDLQLDLKIQYTQTLLSQTTHWGSGGEGDSSVALEEMQDAILQQVGIIMFEYKTER